MTSAPDRWQEMQNDIFDFSEKTFGKGTVKGKITHLSEELDEVLADPTDRHEWADCMILLLGAARCAGLDMDDIYQAMQEKMDINRKRKWGFPDENGIVHHVG